MSSSSSLSNAAVSLLRFVKRRKYATLEELQKFKVRHGEKNLISSLIMNGFLRRQEDGAFILTEKALRFLNEMEKKEVKESV